MYEVRKIAGCFFLAVFLLLLPLNGTSQNRFVLDEGKKSDRIAFKLLNNLMLIPVTINGVELTFLLDTGVSSTILFGAAVQDSLHLQNKKSIKIQGLGQNGSVSAYKSVNNKIKIGAAYDLNHSLYVVYDESLNFSPRMGVPIHGIIGYDFFRSFLVRTNYMSKTIKFWDPRNHDFKNCRNCESFDIVLNNKKPFVTTKMTIQDSMKYTTLLVDSGSSDAVWLFDEFNVFSNGPTKYFEDFLGLGLSGDIHGKRSRIQQLKLGDFVLKDVHVAIPEAESIAKARKYAKRDGSLGGEFLRRFTVFYDYPNNRIKLRKNSNFSDPFHYNMSGITVAHDGIEMIKEKFSSFNSSDYFTDRAGQSQQYTGVSLVEESRIVLVPRYIIAAVSKGSSAARMGLEVGDEIIEINGAAAHKMQLSELNELFRSKEGRTVTLRVRNNNVESKVKITLKKIL